ncbi:MAG: 2-amino-4-hydroxy-6-hydroxymethyldihydropteridine diphosphokinase [Acidimicrobiia bacterium]|nr:2-amino-4-hydroxy-6-hydroxymethyldihydropteridine diphosphokinase [Acidimicrobiia bacterium]
MSTVEPAGRHERAYLGIGSNLGDRLATLQAAVDGLGAADGITVVGVSPVYETAPVGGPEQDDFLNAVVAVDTALSARQLLGVAQRLEQAAQRVRTERWGPRTLDVDVLLVGTTELHEADLEVPHPRMWERGFVMVPLADLDPTLARDARPGRVPCPEPRREGVRQTDLSLRLPR